MRVVLSVLVCFFSLSLLPSYAAENSIAVFDLEKAILESKAYANAQKSLEAVFKDKKAELDKKRKELEKMGRDLRSSSNKEQQEKFRQQQKEYTDLANEYVRNVQQAELESQSTISLLVIAAAEELAKEKKYDLILDSKAVPYYSKTLDVTDAMLLSLDNVWESSKK